MMSLGKLWFGMRGAALVAGMAMPVLAGGQDSQLRAPLEPLQAISAPPPGTLPPQVSVEDELYQMSSQAAVIFAGQVLSIHQQGMLGSGWVEVEFRVEEAIRGCVNQEIYRMREWAGLWVGSERYRVGQRLLLMLHAPAASGFSSPVGGQDGAMPIVGLGAAPKPDDSFTAAAERGVDLRWIEARLSRTAANGGTRLHGGPAVAPEPIVAGRERAPMATRKAQMAGVRSNGRMLGGLGQRPAEFAGSVNPASEKLLTGSGLSQAASLRGVLAMLGAWEAQQANAAR